MNYNVLEQPMKQTLIFNRKKAGGTFKPDITVPGLFLFRLGI
jgi:hypothetical protein